MRRKVLVVFGTRPEAIKMIPVIKQLEENSSSFITKICVTGQHRHMLDQVLDLFSIKPDFDLNLMKHDQTVTDLTSKIIKKMEPVLDEFKPDYMLVHGDTSTSMASSIAAFYKKIKILHVEAGLRTNDLYSPWPEEANRQIVSVLSYINFAPTKESKENLKKENKKNIFITGNTVIDSLFLVVKLIENNKILKKEIIQKLQKEFSFKESRKLILITGHRRENFGEGFKNICQAIKMISSSYENVDIVYPVHLNPNVRKIVKNILGNIPNVYLIEPLPYEVFIYLMKKSYLILTDSGGIQEEAPSLGKPVLVMREISERPEAIKVGTVKLVGAKKDKIFNETKKLLDSKARYKKMSKKHNPYGDGNASKRIVNILLKDKMIKT